MDFQPSTQSRPRVAFFGNMCNLLYQVARALRQQAGFDAHLYIDNFEARRDPQNLPERDDPELQNAYPDWIHRGNYASPPFIVAPFLSPLIAELNSYDVVVLMGTGPMFASFLRPPTIFYVGGGDLTAYPFPFRQWRRYGDWLSKLAAIVRGMWQARGIRRVHTIWSQPFAPFVAAARRLGVEKLVAQAYFPLMLDHQTFSPEDSNRSSPAMREMTGRLKEKFEFIVFHPSRIVDDRSPHHLEIGEWKNNSLLLRAFHRFLTENPGCRAGLVVVDKSRPQGTYTADEAKFRELIASLGLTEHVEWLVPPQHGGFPRWELAELYRSANVVADEFGVGWFGSIVLEGLSSGRPVLCHVDERVMAQLYPSHPILSGNTEVHVSEHLNRLYHDPDYARQIGEKSRQWVLRYHSAASVQHAYSDNFTRFISELTLRGRAD